MRRPKSALVYDIQEPPPHVGAKLRADETCHPASSQFLVQSLR